MRLNRKILILHIFLQITAHNSGVDTTATSPATHRLHHLLQHPNKKCLAFLNCMHCPISSVHFSSNFFEIL